MPFHTNVHQTNVNGRLIQMGVCNGFALISVSEGGRGFNSRQHKRPTVAPVGLFFALAVLRSRGFPPTSPLGEVVRGGLGDLATQENHQLTNLKGKVETLLIWGSP